MNVYIFLLVFVDKYLALKELILEAQAAEEAIFVLQKPPAITGLRRRIL